jgi:DNA-directed RNA polymerase specialized sigma24 family protein
VVELRYFGGMSVEETAAALHVSVDTVMRDWQGLHSQLNRPEAARHKARSG